MMDSAAQVRDFEPGVLEPGPVAVHQPRDRRGRERPRARARAGLPQLHRHVVLPGKELTLEKELTVPVTVACTVTKLN